jgi:hypothetical protein
VMVSAIDQRDPHRGIAQRTRRSARAVARPPNPPPMITMWGRLTDDSTEPFYPIVLLDSRQFATGAFPSTAPVFYFRTLSTTASRESIYCSNADRPFAVTR